MGPLRAVVAEHYRDVEQDSRTELLAHRILTDAGIRPEPESQIPLRCADGVVVTIDLGWPQYRTFVEIFGVDHLTNEDLQHLDLHRRNQIELAGNRLLIYSGRMLRRRPDQFAADVIAMLRAAGWPDWSPPDGSGRRMSLRT
ncbi:MAG: hypothetical protein ACXIVQ_11760 [Acidimicrobiales bacterium]